MLVSTFSYICVGFCFVYYPHPRTCLLILERGREGERNIEPLPLIHTLARNRSQNLGMSSDWESNLQPSVYQMMLSPNEPHWLELCVGIEK